MKLKRLRNTPRTDALQNLTESKTQSLLREREAQITALQKQVTKLNNELVSLNQEYKAAKHQITTSRGKKKLTPYGNLVQDTVSKCGENRRQLLQERARMGRNASIATSNALNALPEDDIGCKSTRAVVNRIMDMFKDPAAHMAYLNSDSFARDLLKLNISVKAVLESEPRCVFLQSPCYVFGDIHGNLEDLHFFSDNIWRLGMSLTAGNFIFLGDYVDRGMNCLECVAYLFAMKLMLPNKVFLLRGNHETRDVNGWEEHYGERSFIYQCRDRFGDDLGFRVWEQTNQVFDRLPLSGVIDQDIFCVHGGIPRPISEMTEGSSRMQDILSVPKVAGINPPYEHEDENYQQVASDCIWSDPASDDQEQNSVDPESGYGESLRGGGAICFGNKAVTDFLQQHNFSYIMRAHEAHAEGVAVSKGARVFTVFSTSKDHNQGSTAMAGCILVDFEKMQVINRSPAYRNQYIHRRDSVSLSKISEQEIEERIRLGLVTTEQEEEEEEEYETGEWEDLEDGDESEEEEDDDDDDDDDADSDDVDDDSDEENYNFSSGRKSSVDPSNTCASPPGSTHNNHDWCDEFSQSELQGGNCNNTTSLDFSNVETSNRKDIRKNLRFSVIAEEDEEIEDCDKR